MARTSPAVGPAGRFRPWKRSHSGLSEVSGWAAVSLDDHPAPGVAGQRGQERPQVGHVVQHVVAGHHVGGGRPGAATSGHGPTCSPGPGPPPGPARRAAPACRRRCPPRSARWCAGPAAGRRRRLRRPRPARCPAGQAPPRPARRTVRPGPGSAGPRGARTPAGAAPRASRATAAVMCVGNGPGGQVVLPLGQQLSQCHGVTPAPRMAGQPGILDRDVAFTQVAGSRFQISGRPQNQMAPNPNGGSGPFRRLATSHGVGEGTRTPGPQDHNLVL